MYKHQSHESGSVTHHVTNQRQKPIQKNFTIKFNSLITITGS